jgi:hypothetical protein
LKRLLVSIVCADVGVILIFHILHDGTPLASDYISFYANNSRV